MRDDAFESILIGKIVTSTVFRATTKFGNKIDAAQIAIAGVENKALSLLLWAMAAGRASSRM
jgi:hypothetical protein